MMFIRMFTDTSNVQTCLTASVYMTISLTLERYFSVVQPLYQLQNRLLRTYNNTTINIWSVETYLKVEGWCCKFTLVQMNWNFKHVLQSETHRTNQNLAFQINFEPPKKFNISIKYYLWCSNVTLPLALKHWNNQDSGSHQILYIGLHCWIFGFNNKNVLWNWKQGSNFYVNDYDWWRHNTDNFIYSFSSHTLS